jgi:D-alanyl-lipoteichoic acid acyltransferase DltB (MBOAT superfamily)
VILPIGISFYTLQTLSYTIDVYRRGATPARNFFDFALYVSFFPQLVAGPIERARTLLPQLERRRQVRSSDLMAAV